MLNIIKKSLLVPKVNNLLGKQVGRTVERIIDQGGYTPGLWSLVHGRPVAVDNRGAVGEKLKYGLILGHELYIPAPIGASEVIKAASGPFVKTDGSGRVEIADSGDTELIGHLNFHEATASATEGGDIGLLNLDRNGIYRIPVANGTYAAAMRYDTCDLLVGSSIQGADVGQSNEDVIILVDGDTDNNNWVDVQINPRLLGVQGVS